MFNWLGNLFPYSDLHSLNLDWILTKMKETAAQAAKAIADSANALAQVVEAKTAAQNAQTAAQDAQTAANKAAGNATSAAANAVQALNAAQTAQETATAANNKAQTAQETANTAQSAAQTAQNAAQTAQNAAQSAQSTAQSAQSTAETAKSTAESAQTNVETLNGKFPIKTVDIAKQAVSNEKLQYKGNSKITTSVLDASGSAIFPSNTGASVSQISEELTGSRTWNFINNTLGEYLQFSIEFRNASNIEIKTINCSFVPVYYPYRTNRPVYIPFIFENGNTGTVIKGYAKFKKTEADDYTFQMFFDVAPTFDEGTIFMVRVKNIGAVMDLHF